MVWVKRRFAFADYARYFDALERLLLQNPAKDIDTLHIADQSSSEFTFRF
jgi:hypothetical protein